MASVADWSTTPASNTTLGGISTDGNVTLVNQIDNIFRGMMSEVATSRDDGTISNVAPRGYISGLRLAHSAGDPTNDIDIFPGICAADTSPYRAMAVSAGTTKRLDAAWAVGSGNGGLDTGSIANTTYHVFLIKRPDTGVVDALFSTSATAPTMPTNYTLKRRIGSIRRQAAAIDGFVQVGDYFYHNPPFLNRSSTAALADSLLNITVPTGIVVQALIFARATASVGNVVHQIGDANLAAVNQRFLDAAAQSSSGVALPVKTNTANQVRYSVVTGGTITVGDTTCYGYIDRRGQDGAD